MDKTPGLGPSTRSIWMVTQERSHRLTNLEISGAFLKKKEKKENKEERRKKKEVELRLQNIMTCTLLFFENNISRH